MIETPSRIEPVFFEDQIPQVLADLSIEIQREAGNLGRGLHPESAAELADLVRMMNSYYSNLIEGHNTRPKDIKHALAAESLPASQHQRRSSPMSFDTITGTTSIFAPARTEIVPGSPHCPLSRVC